MSYQATKDGKTVYVYKHENGKYIDYRDMETEYDKLGNLKEIQYEEIPKDYFKRGRN